MGMEPDPMNTRSTVFKQWAGDQRGGGGELAALCCGMLCPRDVDHVNYRANWLMNAKQKA